VPPKRGMQLKRRRHIEWRGTQAAEKRHCVIATKEHVEALCNCLPGGIWVAAVCAEPQYLLPFSCSELSAEGAAWPATPPPDMRALRLHRTTSSADTRLKTDVPAGSLLLRRMPARRPASLSRAVLLAVVAALPALHVVSALPLRTAGDVFVPAYWPLFTTGELRRFDYESTDASLPPFTSVFSYDVGSASMLYNNYDHDLTWLNRWYYQYRPSFGIAEWRDDYNGKKLVMSPPIGWGEYGSIGKCYKK
jgi:hypothetical protein